MEEYARKQATGTLAEALSGSAPEQPLEICLEPRVYEEKVLVRHRDLILSGAGEKTVLLWHDGAAAMMEDGFRRGTFRSYTAFFIGERLVLRDLTIRNDAGDGRAAGQAVAAAIDCASVYAENCVFDSCQDTLFLAPLPDEERQPRGFEGPTEHTERRRTKQYFRHCRIIGDVDFVFGGADAVFEECEIVCRNRGEQVNGYIAAPSGRGSDTGFLFLRCRITAEEGTAPGSYYLGRPWRPEGRAAYIDCICDGHISPARFSGWRERGVIEEEAAFAECGTRRPDGAPADLNGKNPRVTVPDARGREELLRRAAEIYFAVSSSV